MEKRVTILILWMGSNLLLYGQQEKYVETPRIAVKMNTLIVAGIVNPAVEFTVSERTTVQLEGMGIFQPHGFLWTSRPLSLGATWAEYRFYPYKPFERWFVGANIGWSVYRMNKGLVFPYLKDYADGKYQVGQNYMLGVSLGYRLPLNHRWSLEFMLGGGHQTSHYEGFNSDGTRYVEFNGSGEWVIYKGGLNVVYSF